MKISEYINPFDINELRKSVRETEPFAYFCIDDFLVIGFAEEILKSFPSYEEGASTGKEYNSVNEKNKICIADSELFPDTIKQLNEILASAEFIKMVSDVFEIDGLVADPTLLGGGIHETKEGGRLDVHIDFNYMKRSKLFRRLNILVYFNKDWHKDYGGVLDLWDKDVKNCMAEILPVFNRVVCFATNEYSYHGVTPIHALEGTTRKSFAAYYYTKEPPHDWTGQEHDTVFKARPDEWMKKNVYMPVSSTRKKIKKVRKSLKRKIKTALGLSK